jgi:hypothetical protein
MCTQSVTKLFCILFIYLFIALNDTLNSDRFISGENTEMHSESKQTIQSNPWKLEKLTKWLIIRVNKLFIIRPGNTYLYVFLEFAWCKSKKHRI